MNILCAKIVFTISPSEERLKIDTRASGEKVAQLFPAVGQQMKPGAEKHDMKRPTPITWQIADQSRPSSNEGNRGSGEPLVSIGMPVYNGERFVCQALESILTQDYRNFELIISDNASTDKTSRICQQYADRDARIRYVRNETNLGASPNHHRVFDAFFSSDYVLFAELAMLGEIWELPEPLLRKRFHPERSIVAHQSVQDYEAWLDTRHRRCVRVSTFF